MKQQNSISYYLLSLIRSGMQSHNNKYTIEVNCHTKILRSLDFIEPSSRQNVFLKEAERHGSEVHYATREHQHGVGILMRQ